MYERDKGLKRALPEPNSPLLNACHSFAAIRRLKKRGFVIDSIKMAVLSAVECLTQYNVDTLGVAGTCSRELERYYNAWQWVLFDRALTQMETAGYIARAGRSPAWNQSPIVWTITAQGREVIKAFYEELEEDIKRLKRGPVDKPRRNKKR